MNRRAFLKTLAGTAAYAWAVRPSWAAGLAGADQSLLDDLAHRSFLFFWEQSDPATGITRDRTPGDGSVSSSSRKDVGSTGATGFGLTALCIGAERGWISRDKAAERVRATLKSFVDGPVVPEHGWYYHFVDVRTGARSGTSEMSTSDCTWLVAGALTARQYFRDDPQIVRLATLLYERTDYRWMANGGSLLLSHGWKPESGHIKFRYDKYCQLACMYLLGIGSPTDHALPPDSWYAWERNPVSYGKEHFIGNSLLWTYQFPFAWFDLRGLKDGRSSQLNYVDNAVAMTRAHKAFCLDLAKKFPGYSENLWGITSSISHNGYKAWGGPPAKGPIDGSVVPCASAGSLMFAPELCLPVVREMKERFGDKIHRRYGFTDAFNPTNGWVADDVIGIDIGITLLSIENLRSGNVWKWFMANPEARKALELAEFAPDSAKRA